MILRVITPPLRRSVERLMIAWLVLGLCGNCGGPNFFPARMMWISAGQDYEADVLYIRRTALSNNMEPAIGGKKAENIEGKNVIPIDYFESIPPRGLQITVYRNVMIEELMVYITEDKHGGSVFTQENCVDYTKIVNTLRLYFGNRWMDHRNYC